jgi:hypothetical protein
MLKDAKLKLTMQTGGRWKFKLKNGLTATLYRLDNKKAETVALTCEKPIVPHASGWALLPNERKHHHAIELTISGETIYLVYFCGTPPSQICTDLQQDEKFKNVYLIVHHNKAYYTPTRTARFLLDSIRTNTSPSICALMSNED